jgi:hypothetical protein
MSRLKKSTGQSRLPALGRMDKAYPPKVLLHFFISPLSLFVPRETSIRVSPASTTSRDHQRIMNWVKEKGTISREKIISTEPRMRKTIEGTTYLEWRAP